MFSHCLIPIMDTPKRIDDDTKDEKNDVQQIEILDADLDVKDTIKGAVVTLICAARGVISFSLTYS